MRRWELVEGTASKFWETGAVGATVTVRYGRCGSEGRTRTKEYASEEAAHAQVRRTVAEKERRGYEQVAASACGADGATDTGGATRADGATGTGGAVGAALPDETTFRLPLSWRRVLHPRRGGCARPLGTADEEASARVGERIAGEAAWIELILAEPGSDPELVEATRAHLAGSPSPAGAAALAAVVSVEGAPACWVDTWVAEHGLPFAARAAQELQTIKAHSYHALGRRVKGALKRVSLSSPLHWHHGSLNVAARARAHIAAADEETYLATVAALARARRDSHQRITAAFLAPSETEWVEALLSEPAVLAEDHYVLQRMVLSSLTSADQLARLPYRPDPTLSVIATLADGIGTGVAPMLGTYLDHGHHYAEGVKAVSAALTELPTDEAFAILLHHKELKHVRAALLDAMRRYPVRALRLLAADVRHSAPTRSRASRQLLHAHINTHRPLVAALLPTLPAGAAEVVGPLLNPVSRFPEASAASLPAALTRPPWTRARAGAAAAPVDTGAAELPAPELCWLPGEQEAWARCSTWYTRPQHDGDWEKVISSPLEGLDSTGLRPAWIFLHAPAERITPALATWAPTDLWDGADTLRPVVARFGLGALPLLLRTVPRQPSTMAALFLPFADVTVARHMADWAARLKSTAATTRTWFARHGAAAAAFLVPDAVGKPGAARRAAEQALIQIAAVHGEKTVRDAAARYGAQAVRSVDVLLVTDPLERALPAKLPVLPNWAEPGLLPQLLTRTGEALPAEVVRTALTMFALSRPGEVYPGVGALREATDPASLAAFGWAVFEQWLDARLPAKESWALYVLGEVGDDETVRRLTPVVRAWPGEGAHHRAVEGLDVLAAIGSETALLHLHGIGQRVRFKALKTRAQEKIAEVAAALGLSSEQLSDRLVPDFGLDPDGSLVVDFGPRRFTVGFDERLAPYVVDASGRRLRDLPAPAAGDDQESASAGRERFLTLRRDVRTIAAGQVHRLETAMVSGRSWTTEEFRDLFVTHPLVGHPVRRLVWQSASRGTVTAFRVTADGAFADAGGGPLVLPANASVRIAHPLRLGGARAEWSEALSRLGLAQPFPQLERVVRSLTDEERTSDRLHRFEGLTVPTAAVLGLERRGWEPGAPGDAGVRGWISKRLGEDVYLVVCLHEGVVAGSPESFPEQRLEAVRLSDRPGAPRPRGPHRPLFGCLDPVTASEVLADLTALAGVRRSPAGGGPAVAPGRTVAAAGQGRSR